MTNSWIGPYQTVYKVLSEIGADFLLDSEQSQVFTIEGPLTLGIGGLEVVVGPEVVYFLKNEPRSLLEQLKTVNDGIMIGVI